MFHLDPHEKVWVLHLPMHLLAELFFYVWAVFEIKGVVYTWGAFLALSRLCTRQMYGFKP